MQAAPPNPAAPPGQAQVAAAAAAAALPAGNKSALKQLQLARAIADPTADFFESQSLLGRMAFLVFLVVVFILLVRLTMTALGMAFRPPEEVCLVKGMMDGKHSKVVQQGPAVNPGQTLYRSENQEGGLEFTYTLFFFIDDTAYQSGKYRQLLVKGDTSFGMPAPGGEGTVPGMSMVNGPGIYLHPHRNDLVVCMATERALVHRLTVPNIPLSKWVHCAVTVRDQRLSVWINGELADSTTLNGPAKQNWGNLTLCGEGGFDGTLADVYYFARALTDAEVRRLAHSGIRNRTSGSALTAEGMRKSTIEYLSQSWFTG